MARILLDLNNPVFQESLFSLEREEALAALATLKKSTIWTGINFIAIEGCVGKQSCRELDQRGSGSIVFA